MAVPEQVRKQTEAVQQLYADLNEDETATSPEKGEVVALSVEEPAVQEVVADSVGENVPTPDPIEPGEGSQGEDFEQKYLTLQGMYNSQVPQLQAQNQELGGRLQKMEQLIATMQAMPAVPESTPEPVSALTSEEVEEYGESIDIMRKVSQEVAGHYQQEITELKNTIQQLQGTVLPRVEHIAHQQEQSVEQAFWSDLATTVPDWKNINEDQGFQSWLLEVDPLSGLTRQTYLEDAQRNMDAQRVASFFVAWQKVNGTPEAQPNRSASNSELEKQVAPGKSRNSGTPAGNKQKTYTPQDISQFFDDVRTGAYKGKEEERDTIERDIFAAQSDGRIVNA